MTKNDSGLNSVKILNERTKTLLVASYKLKQQHKIDESTDLVKGAIHNDWTNFNMGNADSAFSLYRWFTNSFGAIQPNLDIAYIFFGVAQKLGIEKCQKEIVSQTELQRLSSQINKTCTHFKIAQNIIKDREIDNDGIYLLLMKYYVTITLPNGQSLAEAVYTTIHPDQKHHFENNVSQFSPQHIVRYCLGDLEAEVDTVFKPTTKQAIENVLYFSDHGHTKASHNQHHKTANEHTKLTGDDDGCFSHCVIL